LNCSCCSLIRFLFFVFCFLFGYVTKSPYKYSPYASTVMSFPRLVQQIWENKWTGYGYKGLFL
jgi:hypothetical protein